ncbi:DNA methyltransferase [uncultured Treponema sp.]|uniref:DNA methyltransferase n=1 Tax=uncultured Treponema sp. TaxID=162155 RepID=UPI0025DB529A|nr:DNA methyltransferase [uncultured Treponema sp.]
MTRAEQTKNAKKFAENWLGHGYEKGESQKFWIDLLTCVFGVADIANFIFFEEQVKDKIQNKTITNFIDAYIPSTRVMIEQKSSHKDLREPIKQSDGSFLTPYQQAKKYVADLPLSQHPKWIVTCNFDEFLVYDMENPSGEPEQIFLKDLEKDFYRLQFLSDTKNENIRREEEISLKAGELVGKLYDALYKEYIEPEENSLRSLNILCVRIVFCLYAEDAGLFETKSSFEDYIKSFAIENLRDGIIKLFKSLDTKLSDRDKYDLKLKPFPYVNGGLFRDEKIEIPNFTQEIVDVIVNHCAPFNWSEISPTIFGAVFESTLNPDTRRKGGMHYTSIQNIHKVIDPLFMDELNSEFEQICATKAAKQKIDKLYDFQEKLGSLKFLDPACGSGNFLTETYLSLRRLENKVLSILNEGHKKLGFDEFIKVHINQFYGIEINDFAVTVAKTALWIAESQMVAETEAILSQTIDFLPLKTGANIIEGNALQLDWATLSQNQKLNALYAEKLNIYKDLSGATIEIHDSEIEESALSQKYFKELNVVAKEVEFKIDHTKSISKPIVYDYIIGNPPFVGYAFQSEQQKKDLALVVKNIGKNIDYVVGWYIKASRLIHGSQTKCAFVSTNSIIQGEQVAEVWKPLFEENNIQFDFAYKTFVWDSESSQKAHVHCVILGFSDKNSNQKEKIIFDENGNKTIASNISPYLIDAPNVFVEKRKNPLCKVSKINKGSQPTDGGNLIIEAEEYDEFIKKEPAAKKFIREFLGAEEFINGKKRYCLWLVNASPAELRKMSLVAQRVAAVKEMRLSSSKESTQNWAAYPYLFTENRQPESGNYLLIPRVSSEKRSYIPIGYVSSDIIASDAVQIVPNASLYEFGILTSSIHNAWMRVVCGRLKSDYRYSNDIVYNNFVWCNPTAEQKAKIEQTAQAILDTRANFPDSTLADLYDETFMPQELRKAHQANDKAVIAAYGFPPDITESEIVGELFKLYEKLAK